jgi:hypothetical protein
MDFQDHDKLKTAEKNKHSFFDYSETKARHSTFSKTSEGRNEEILNQNVSSIYEKAFIQDNSSIGFLHPIDDDECSQCIEPTSPCFNK